MGLRLCAGGLWVGVSVGGWVCIGTGGWLCYGAAEVQRGSVEVCRLHSW